MNIETLNDPKRDIKVRYLSEIWRVNRLKRMAESNPDIIDNYLIKRKILIINLDTYVRSKHLDVYRDLFSMIN